LVAHLDLLSWTHTLSHKPPLVYSILHLTLLSRKTIICSRVPISPLPLTCLTHACTPDHQYSMTFLFIQRSSVPIAAAVDIRNINQTPFLLFFQLPAFVMPNSPSSTLCSFLLRLDPTPPRDSRLPSLALSRLHYSSPYHFSLQPAACFISMNIFFYHANTALLQ
jgi:hypothetical protein